MKVMTMNAKMIRYTTGCMAALVLCAALLPVRVHAAGRIFLSIPQEVELGLNDYESIPKVTNKAMLDRLHKIGARLAKHSQKRTGIDYMFSIEDYDDLNAFCSFGGYIYVSSGLMEFIEDDELLAAVIAHEMVHADNRDVANAIENYESMNEQLKFMVDSGFVEGVDPDKFRIQFDDLLNLGLARTDEFAADAYGSLYLYRAGYNPYAMVEMLQLLADTVGDHLPAQAKWMDHPSFTERIDNVQQFIDRMQIAQEKFDSGLRALDRANWDRAVSDFSQYLSMFYGSREAYNNIGYAYFMKAMGSTYDVTWMWNPSIAPPPEDQVEIAALRGSLEAEDDGFNEDYFDYNSLYNAYQYFTSTLAIDPNYAPAVCNMAAVLWTMDKKDQARDQIESLNQSGAACYHNTAGIFLAQGGDLEAAREHFAKALAAEPANAAPRFNIALAYQLGGDAENAVTAWDEFVGADRNIPDFWLERAFMFMDEL